MIELLLNSTKVYDYLATDTRTDILTNTSQEIEIDAEYPFDPTYSGLILKPISCKLTQELNGTWELELINPLDEYFDYINENEVLRVDTPNFDKQMFRISYVEKTDKTVRALAYPIFLDSADEVFLFDNRPTDCNGQEALDWMTAGTKYSGSSDIININTAYYENRNLVEAIAGNIEQSFLNRWGGEVLYDNYRIIINRQIGTDNNVRCETGFNLIGLRETIDMSNVVTRYVPKAYNGYMLNEKYIDSPNIDRYPKIYTRVIDCSKFKLQEDCAEGEIGFETLALMQEAMKLYCRALMDEGMDIPAISYDINMVDLSNTNEYRDYQDLTKIRLGDIVHCRHRRLNIVTDARVIKLVWDCVYKEIQSITLGAEQKDYFKDSSAKINEAINKTVDDSYLEQWLSAISNKNSKTLIAEKINGAIDGFKAQLKAQKDIAHKEEVRAILFEDIDTESPTFGAMAIGTQGFQIANKKVEGSDEWNWTTLGTANGFYATDIYGSNITGLTINAGILNGAELHFGNYPNGKYVTVKNTNSDDGIMMEGNGTFELHNNDESNRLMNRLSMVNTSINANSVRLENYDSGNYVNALIMNSHLTTTIADLFYDRTIVGNYNSDGLQNGLEGRRYTNGTNKVYIRNRTNANVLANQVYLNHEDDFDELILDNYKGTLLTNTIRLSNENSPTAGIYIKNNFSGFIRLGNDSNVIIDANQSLDIVSDNYNIYLRAPNGHIYANDKQID